MANQEEDSPVEGANAQVSSGLIFVSDASAEAERLTVALRSRGYATVDVPLGLLATRVAVQKPALILCDADASGVLQVVEALGKGDRELRFVFLGDPDGVIATGAERLRKHSQAVFTRPVEVYALLRKVEALIGDPPEGTLSGSVTHATRAPVLVAAARKPYMVDASHGAAKAAWRQPPSPGPPPIPSSLPPTAWHTERGEPDAQLSLLPEPSIESNQGLPHSHLSKELTSILHDAERRLESEPLRELRQHKLSPEAEIDAVLPPEVLASLDDPLDDDDDFELDVSGGTKSGSEPGGTSPGTQGDNDKAEDADDPQSRATNPGGSVPKPRAALAAPSASELPPTDPPPSPPGTSMTPGPQSLNLSAAVTAVGAPESEAGRAFSESGEPTGTTPDGGSLSPISEVGAQVPTSRPSHLNRPLQQAVAAADELAAAHVDDRERPKAAIPAGFPRPLGDGIARSSFARVIRQRLSGALVFEDAKGIRRIVFRDGDFVTAASGVDEESLVTFLALRGDLSSDAAAQLGRRLPPFGRHAGAALIANGHLKQDELWSVLRAHAEWLIGQLIRLEAGHVDWESEVPDRLRAEPAVFGGSTGAEVFVDTLRRGIPAERALSTLGGGKAELGHGEHFELLGECALSAAELDLVRRAPLLTLELAQGSGAPQDFPTVCLALVELGVLNQGSATVRTANKSPAKRDDPLDDQALRSRLIARYALVHEGDYFALLGISRNATDYEVQRAHEALKQDLLPERVLTARNADLRDKLETVLEVIEEAFEVLGDQIRRERYRAALEAFPS